MKWFKHDSDAHMDRKLKKLKLRFGLEGYGLYWHCLELIAGDIGPSNLTFELPHDAEIIASDTGLHQDRVEDMMRYMVSLGLFEGSNGMVTCLTMAHRLDASMTGNSAFRRAIKQMTNPTKSENVPTQSVLSHDSVMNREERREKREDNRSSADDRESLFDSFWDVYPRKVNKAKSKVAFDRLSLKKQKLAIDDIKAGRFAGKEIQFIPHATTYIHGERWEDEREPEVMCESAVDVYAAGAL